MGKAGERLYLSYLPAGGQATAAARVVDAVRFKGQEDAVSLGRYPDGGAYWYAMSPTQDAGNTEPHERLVVNELMFHPADDTTATEYIELLNPTSQSINLWNAEGPWRLDGAQLYFPANTTLPPGGLALLVNFDPADAAQLNAFKATYGLAAIPAPIFGPYDGNLSNKGERFAIERPLAPYLPGDTVAWVIVDEVIYFDRAPWTPQADGTGLALHRLSTDGSGNDPANWLAGPPSPGTGSVVTEHTLTILASHGWVLRSPDQAVYEHGAVVQLTPIAETGYRFFGWAGDVPAGHEADNPLSLTMDANKTLTALFVLKTYSLTVAAVNGSVQRVPDQPVYDHGTVVTLTALPAARYHFAGWTGNVPTGHEADNPLALTMDADKSLTANFEIEQSTGVSGRWSLYR